MYEGVDQSEVMIEYATDRMSAFAPRARVRRIEDGEPSRFGEGCDSESVDVVVSTYVLDILSDDDIASMLTESYRVLKKGGVLCLSGLTYGQDFRSKIVATGWAFIHFLNPAIVGGCRAQELSPYLGPGWTVREKVVVSGAKICSEVLVAVKN
mmetsp:Transcript_78536/g.115010  ORF Transcript_78536/g.115010 Transcript_78536/m.115010 type:complete len:153 (+) Transcript_78536:1-459(+)